MENTESLILYSIDLDCFASEYGCKLIVAARNVLEESSSRASSTVEKMRRAYTYSWSKVHRYSQSRSAKARGSALTEYMQGWTGYDTHGSVGSRVHQ